MPTKLPICVEMPSPGDAGPPPVRAWPQGVTLRIRFLDGAHTLQAKVAEAAGEWLQYAHLGFAFGDDLDAQIRITFADEALWSYVGTDALFVAKELPTLSLGALTTRTAHETLRRVVLHMFGHVLGMTHEHQTPTSSMKWNLAKLYAYFAVTPYNWSQLQVYANILKHYADSMTNTGTFDPQSIMLAPIPSPLIIGDFVVGWNDGLSKADVIWAETWYPRLAHAMSPDEATPGDPEGETQSSLPDDAAAAVKDATGEELPPATELQEERIRLDVATPDTVNRDIPFDLAVAVQQPEAPVLDEAGLPKVVSKPGVVYRPDTESVIEYRIEVSGSGCDVDPAAETIQLHRGENAAPVYFRVTAHRAGQQSLFVKAYQADHKVAAQTRVLITVQIPVEEPPIPPTPRRPEDSATAPLTPAELQQFETALLGAFERGELSRVVYVGLGVDLDTIVAPGTLADEVHALVMWANRQQKVDALLKAAQTQNPGNGALREFADRLAAR